MASHFFQNTLPTSDCRLLKNAFILAMVLTTWAGNVDTCTTRINAAERGNLHINKLPDSAGNLIIDETFNSNTIKASEEMKNVILGRSHGLLNVILSQNDISNTKGLLEADGNDADNVIESVASDNKNLKQLKLQEFKQYLHDTILKSTGHKYTKSSSSGSVVITDNKHARLSDDSTATTPVHRQKIQHLYNVVNQKKTFRPQVVFIISRPKGRNRNSVITVPLEADMTVLNTLLSATRTYIQRHPTDVDDNPFNILIDYDRRLDCYVTINAVGIDSRRRHAWIFTVRNADDEVVYRGQCIPGEDIILRPESVLFLTFGRIRSRKSM